jgi:hypothetical protein
MLFSSFRASAKGRRGTGLETPSVCDTDFSGGSTSCRTLLRPRCPRFGAQFVNLGQEGCCHPGRQHCAAHSCTGEGLADSRFPIRSEPGMLPSECFWRSSAGGSHALSKPFLKWISNAASRKLATAINAVPGAVSRHASRAVRVDEPQRVCSNLRAPKGGQCNHQSRTRFH